VFLYHRLQVLKSRHIALLSFPSISWMRSAITYQVIGRTKSLLRRRARLRSAEVEMSAHGRETHRGNVAIQEARCSLVSRC